MSFRLLTTAKYRPIRYVKLFPGGGTLLKSASSLITVTNFCFSLQEIRMSQVFEESGITIVPESTDTFIENKEGNKNCEICKDKEWIYTCPRCLIHTCSLKCVQHHKKETKCSGTRDKTAYIPLQKYTESHMMSGKLPWL